MKGEEKCTRGKCHVWFIPTAVFKQVYPSQNYYQKARLQCAEYIQSHQDDFKEVCVTAFPVVL